MNSELQKMASIAIKELVTELDETKDQLEVEKLARKLAFSMYKTGSLVAQDLESTIEEFSTKSKDELLIVRKALDYTKTAEAVSLFRISNVNTSVDSESNPLIRYLMQEG